VKARSAVLYSVLRLLAFLVPFGVLMLFPIFRELYWLAAIFAALIGLSLSLLFLRRPLTEVTSGLAQRRERSHSARSDEDIEDAAADETARHENRSPDAQPASADERPHQERPEGD
jgi:ABC-type siderophore export system fused ATPase/permease subunit